MSRETVKLGDISLNIQTGPFGSQLHQSDYSEKGTPVVMPKDLVNGSISEQSVARVTEEHVRRLNRHIINEGDIIYSRRGDVGRCAYATSRESGWLCGTGCLRVTINTEIADSKYVFYCLQQPATIGWVEKHAIGATMLNLNTTILSNIPISLPVLQIQCRIADILSTYDNLIENNQKQIKLLEEAAQRLYKEWFVDLHFPGYENVAVVDGVPERWKRSCLEEVICKITTGLNPRKNFVLGHGKNYYVTIKNMRDNNIYLDEKCDRIDEEALEKINKRSNLQVGDILFSGIGTMGRVYLINIPTDNWNVSESVFTMRANNLISKEFLYLMLLSNEVQTYCDQHAHGVAQRGIRMADLKTYKFVLPNEEILSKFTSLVRPLIRRVQVLQVQIAKIKEARDRLLPKLMSGELEV